MTEHEYVYYAVKGAIFDLPQEEQNKVTKAYEQLKKVEELHGSYGLLAMALRGAELAAGK